jgi:hypothetical protein
MGEMLETTLENNKEFTPEHRLLLIVGNYGSGKTEVSVNLAVREQQLGKRVTIADLDIVNPYFRCREARERMLAAGVRVVIPPGAQQYADLPIVVPEIKGMLQNGDVARELDIFDVGGDPAGATLLSSFNSYIAEQPYHLFQVINSRRPFTDSVEGCLEMKRGIEAASRLSVTGLVVNSHLAEQTTPDVIVEGYELAREVGERAGLPVAFVTAMGDLADAEEVRALPVPVLRLERMMLPPWLQVGEKTDNPDETIVPAGRTKPVFVP